MSGLDNMIAEMKAETERECISVKEAARLSAEKSIAEAEEAAEQLLLKAQKEGEALASALSRKAEAEAQTDSRNGLLAEKIRLIDETLKETAVYLHNLNDEAYFDMLFSFAAAERQPGRKGVMYLNQKDLTRLPADFSHKLGANIEIADTPVAIEDGFILKYGDIEMNCTLNAMFKAYREELKTRAAAVLFG